MDQPPAHGRGDRLRAAQHLQLGEDRAQMRLDRRLADGKPRADLLVAQPVAQQGQHGQLAWGQGLAAHARGQLGHQRRGQAGLARMHLADRGQQFLARRVLQQIAPGAGLEHARDFGVGIEGGQDQDAGRGVFGPDLGDGRDAIADRHTNVQQGHVGPQFAPQGDGLQAIGGLGNHAHVGLPADHRRQAFADGHVVVGNQHADQSHRNTFVLRTAVLSVFGRPCGAHCRASPRSAASGNTMAMATPAPGAVAIASVPAISRTRSAMPTRP